MIKQNEKKSKIREIKKKATVYRKWAKKNLQIPNIKRYIVVSHMRDLQSNTST